MTDEIETTRAGPAHAAVLAALHASAFPPAEAWETAEFAALLSTLGACALLAPATEPRGFVLARAAGDEAEILTLATDPAHRRQGIARTLLDALMRCLHQDGVTRLFLEVSTANVAAQALYRAAGFTLVGRRPRYYADGSDALVLRQEISPD